MGDLSDQQEFFRDLVAEIRSLRQENHDLKDQIGETNRDLMKLEFRVDTHSESFRPLNLTAEPEDTTYDDGPGVLPPRAEPVGSFNE
jgi:predicted RNase H-like nuclease (RuvC/YqgF family)